MQNSLTKGERVEIRNVMTLEPRIQKARISRNPKTLEKINISEKKTIHFKMSKDMFNKINNDE